MASKEDLILTQLQDVNGHLMTIKEDIGGIKQHLKNLNNRVAAHEKKINLQETELNKVKKTVYTMVGGLAVIVLILQILI